MHRNGRGPSSVLAEWRVHGVSVQGYSHLRDGVECQDAHRHAEVPGSGAHVLAVADGAGSRPRSAEGSALAVGLATDTFVERVSRDGVPDGPGGWRRLLTAGHTAASSAFLAAVQRLGRDPRDFATTLTTVVWAPPWLGVASIGDGFVVARA